MTAAAAVVKPRPSCVSMCLSLGQNFLYLPPNLGVREGGEIESVIKSFTVYHDRAIDDMPEKGCHSLIPETLLEPVVVWLPD